MVLWTIASPEYVMMDMGNMSGRGLDVTIDNVPAEVYDSGDGYKIRRIYSTNPRDYLCPRFQPGTAADLHGQLYMRR